MRASVLTAILLVFLSLIGCGLETSESMGCLDEEDCRDQRICVDHICVFAEEAETMERAETLANRIFLSLKRSDQRYYMSVWPTVEDLEWGFEDLTFTRLAELESELENEFLRIIVEYDFSSAEFESFEAGLYLPIREGENLARRDLDILKNSTLRFTDRGESHTINIGRLVRLRGRWRLFEL